MIVKLSKLILLSFLAGCSSGGEQKVITTAVNAVELTSDSTPTESYWVVKNRSYPRYPVIAVREGISGCVEFSFVIESGKAKNIEIIKSVPNSIFDKEALKSIREYRWQASEKNSAQKAVTTTLQLDFSFTPTQKVPECLVAKT